MGPIVKCLNPINDYGLVKVNSHEDYEIEIENTSPIPAEILIKNSKNHRLDFSNMVSLGWRREGDLKQNKKKGGGREANDGW